MGQEQSRPGAGESRGGRRRRSDRGGGEGGSSTSDVSLWEGVEPEVLWLVQSQVKLLLHKHGGSLLHRPEQLQTKEDDLNIGANQELQPHEIRLAVSALRDRKLHPHLQRALDRLVNKEGAQLTEAQFWDNFFSHVDVIKLRVVTDFLQAQDIARADLTKRHDEWVAAYDACSPQLQAEPKRAAELIASQQRPPAPLTVDTGMGLDPPEPTRWAAGGEAWTEYVEHGPHEIHKVIQRTLKQRAAREASMPTGSSSDLSSVSSAKPKHRSASQEARSEAPLLRSLSFAGEETDSTGCGQRATSEATQDQQALAAMRAAAPEAENAPSPGPGLATTAQPATVATPPAAVDEAALERLQQLGFEGARCREALLKHEGDETRAADWLLLNG